MNFLSTNQIKSAWAGRRFLTSDIEWFFWKITRHVIKFANKIILHFNKKATSTSAVFFILNNHPFFVVATLYFTYYYDIYYSGRSSLSALCNMRARTNEGALLHCAYMYNVHAVCSQPVFIIYNMLYGRYRKKGIPVKEIYACASITIRWT